MKLSKLFKLITCVCLLLNQAHIIQAAAPEFNITASIKEGYESNVFLDSKKKSDTFNDTSVFVDMNYKINDKCAFLAEYSMSNLAYSEYTDFSVIDNSARFFLSKYIKDNLQVRAGYMVDYLWYYHEKNGTYFSHGPLTDVTYYFSNDLYFSAGYAFEVYDYDEKKVKDGKGTTIDKTREDYRHLIDFELGKYFGKFLVKVGEKIDFNDSNDEYMDYYDYNAYQTSVSLSFPFYEKFYLSTYGSYRIKDFTERKNSELNAKEDQDTMSLGTRVYYNIFESAYISAGYTYIQNDSNEPANNYSDSISSAGFHIFF